MRHFQLFLVRMLNLSLESTTGTITIIVAGVLVIGLMTNSLYQIIVEGGANFAQQVRVWLFIIGLLGLAYFIYRYTYRENQLIVKLDEAQEVKPKSVLITGLSPYKAFKSGSSNLDVVTNLIKENGAKQVYLISALDEKDGTVFAHGRDRSEDRKGLEESYENLKKHPDCEGIKFYCITIKNEDSAQDAYEAGTKVLNDLKLMGLLNDAVVDVTAGRKAMSVGLSLAAVQSAVSLTYLSTPRDKEGEPDFNAETSLITTLNAEYLNQILLALDKQ